MSGLRSHAYAWALTGIFAAFHAVVTIIPYTVLGMGGGVLTWGMVSAPILGFLLGPLYGPIAAFIGSLASVAIFNPGGILGPLVPTISPTVGALAAGLLRTRRIRLAFLVYILAIVAYILSPIGILAITFIWLHFITVILLFILMLAMMVPKLSKYYESMMLFDKSMNYGVMIILIFLYSFIAVMTDHIMGTAVSAFYFVYFGVFPDPVALADLYLAITFVYPVERLVAGLILGAIILATGIAIREANLPLPTLPWEGPEEPMELNEEEMQ